MTHPDPGAAEGDGELWQRIGPSSGTRTEDGRPGPDPTAETEAQGLRIGAGFVSIRNGSDNEVVVYTA